MQFMRKYIHLAKGMKPTLTRAASDYIAEEYTKLRNQDNLTQEHIARVSASCVQCRCFSFSLIFLLLLLVETSINLTFGLTTPV